MKIKKIEEIKNYATFTNFNWSKSFSKGSTFSKSNIIFGENATGKTSICNILKSVSQYDEETLQPEEQPEENTNIVIKANNDTYTYANQTYANQTYPNQTYPNQTYPNQSWSRKLKEGRILFFDSKFIAENLSEDRDSEGKQKSARQLINVDKRAIELRKDIADKKQKKDEAKKSWDEKKGEKKNFEKDNEENLKKMPKEYETLYENHKNLTKEDIETKTDDLSKTKTNIEKKLEEDTSLKAKSDAISSIEEIRQIRLEISLSELSKFTSIFTYSLKEQTKISAEKALIEKIKNEKTFFDKGIAIRGDYPNKCPFCQSEQVENEIKHVIEIYNSMYDEEYHRQLEDFKEQKKTLEQELENHAKEIKNFNLKEVFYLLKKLKEKYRDSIADIYSADEEKERNNEHENLSSKTISVIESLKSKLEKLEKPDGEDVSALYNEVSSVINDFNNFVVEIDKFIKEKNERIKKFKSENTSEGLLKRINERKEKLKDVKLELKFFRENIIEKEKLRLRKQSELYKLEKCLVEKNEEFKKKDKKWSDAKEDHEKYCSDALFKNMIKGMTKYFKKFNLGFDLELGRTGGQGGPKDLYFDFIVKESNGKERKFESQLSNGEKQVIALCYFFAYIDIQQENINEKIVVFDDPITSLDNNNLAQLVNLIYDKRKDFSQTFIFTHHQLFFKLLRRKFNGDKDNYEAFNVIRNSPGCGGSFLCKHKSKLINKLRKYEGDIRKEASSGIDVLEHSAMYAQLLRYQVEKFVKQELLAFESHKFSDIIDKVKELVDNIIDKSDLDELHKIYRHCNWAGAHSDNTINEVGSKVIKDNIKEFLAIYDRIRPPKTTPDADGALLPTFPPHTSPPPALPAALANTENTGDFTADRRSTSGG